MVDPTTKRRKLFLWARTIKSILSNLMTFSLALSSDDASLAVSTESSQLTVLWEEEREQSRCHLRRDSDWKLRRPSCTPQAGSWLSLGCEWRGWLTQPLFWLDHGFGLGKHFIKLISTNEAELTIWCLKTLVIAKCPSNPSHPHTELKSCDLFHSESSRDEKGRPLRLSCAV